MYRKETNVVYKYKQTKMYRKLTNVVQIYKQTKMYRKLTNVVQKREIQTTKVATNNNLQTFDIQILILQKWLFKRFNLIVKIEINF